MGHQPAAHGLDYLGMGGPDLGPDQAGQPLGIAFARRERLKQGPATLAHDVREHRAELDVGGLQGLIDALDVAGLLAGQLLASAGEVAQDLLGDRWDEAGPNETMGQQIGQPRGVIHVGFAPWHGLDVVGVGQHQLKVPAKTAQTAVVDTAVLAWARSQIETLMERYPKLAMNALRIVGGRAELML